MTTLMTTLMTKPWIFYNSNKIIMCDFSKISNSYICYYEKECSKNKSKNDRKTSMLKTC